MEDNINVIIEESEYSKQYKVKRTIVDLIDVETGEYVDADEVLTDRSYNDKAVFSKMREALILAQKSGNHKYVCAICNQPVRLNSRQYHGCDHISNFFSHFSYSDDCPAKTSSGVNIINQTGILYSRFKQSEVHESMYKKLSKFLNDSSVISDIQLRNDKDSNRILESTLPEIEFTYKEDNKVSIDFQLYTTFISKILEKTLISRKQKSCSMWIFPFFSPIHQEMCAKDIYYSNRRNVFVFDSKNYYTTTIADLTSFKGLTPTYQDYRYAQEESAKSGKLMLNCFWQVPAVSEGGILQIRWEHKLVSLDELTFDKDTGDVFYYDSDKDFNDFMDSDSHELLLEWNKQVRKRWELLEKAIAKRPVKSNYEPIETKDQKKIKAIKSLLASGERISTFYDWHAYKYGYQIGAEIIIKAQYYEAKEFDSNGIAIVKLTENGKYGAINLIGKKVINNQFNRIEKLDTDSYVCTKDDLCGLWSITRGEIIKPEYRSISKLTDDRILVRDAGYYPYYAGNKKQNDQFRIYDLEGNAVTEDYNSITHLLGDYVYAEKGEQKFLLDTDGNIISREFTLAFDKNEWTINAIDNELIFISRKDSYSSICWSRIISFRGEEIFQSTDYDKILPFDDAAYEVFNKKGRALISNINFNIIVSERHDFDNGYVKEWTLGWTLYDDTGKIVIDDCAQIDKTVQNYFIIKNHNGKYHVIDHAGNTIIPPNYTYIGYFTDNRIIAKDPITSSYGVINERMETILPFKFTSISYNESQFRATKGDFWGLYSYDGEVSGDQLTTISDTHTKVHHMGKWAFADKSGKLLTDYLYDDIQKFAMHLYRVEVNGKSGIIDDSLTTILKSQYENIELLPDGNLKVMVYDKYGIYDTDGKCMIHADFEEITLLPDSNYYVSNKNRIKFYYFEKDPNGFAIYNNKGKEMIKYGSADSIEFTEGGYIIIANGFKSFVKTNGDPVPDQLEPINFSYSIGYFMGAKALYNQNGEKLTDFSYNEIVQLTDNLIIAQDIESKNWGLLSASGTKLTDFIFDRIVIENNVIKVKMNNRYYELNDEYEVVPLIHSTRRYDITQVKDEYTIKDKSGEILHTGCYNQFIIDKSSYFIVSYDGENFGVINERGQCVIHNIYDRITRLNATRFNCVQKKVKDVRQGRSWVRRTFYASTIIDLDKDTFLFKENTEYEGIITNITSYGLFVQVEDVGTALLHISELKKNKLSINSFAIDDEIKVRVQNIDYEKKRATLELIGKISDN